MGLALVILRYGVPMGNLWGIMSVEQAKNRWLSRIVGFGVIY